MKISLNAATLRLCKQWDNSRVIRSSTHTSHQAITIIDVGAAENDVSGLAKPSNTLVKICVLDKLGSESKAKKNIDRKNEIEPIECKITVAFSHKSRDFELK